MSWGWIVIGNLGTWLMKGRVGELGCLNDYLDGMCLKLVRNVGTLALFIAAVCK